MMQCPRCGYELAAAQTQASVCPQCGLPLPGSAEQSVTGDGAARIPPIGMPPTEHAPAAPLDQIAAPSMPLPRGYPPYSVPSAPGTFTGPPDSTSPVQATANLYGVPAAPSTPFGAPPTYPYGMPASPSVPYGFNAPYPGWGASPAAPVPPHRTNRLLIASLLIALVVIVGGSAAAILALSRQQPTISAAQPTGSSTATATATATPADTVIYQSSLQGDAAGWSQSLGQCMPNADGYHVKDAICFAPAGMLQDVDISVQVQQISGDPTHFYGIDVRHAGRDKRYDVGINSNSQWGATRCNGPKADGTPDCTTLKEWTENSAIRGGLNTINTLEVRATGSHFEVYVNSVDVGGFDDATYTSGQIGIGSGPVECVYTNIVVKRLHA